MSKEEIVRKLKNSFLQRRINSQFFVDLYNQGGDSSLVTEVVQEHFESILLGCISIDLPFMLEKLCRHNDMYSFLIHNTPMLLKTLKVNFFKIPEKFQRKQFINQHFLELTQELSADCFFSMASQEGFIEEENRDLLNSYLEEHKEEYISFLLGTQLGYIYTPEELSDLMSLLTMLVDEILQTENLRYIDIKKLSSGSFSDLIEIGSKVLKLGDERLCYHIPNDPHILKSLIRVNLKDVSPISGTLEVVEKVDTNFIPSTFELYSLYDSLRSQGIIWIDISIDNVGILLKDNTYHYAKVLSFDPATRGLIGEDSSTILPEGELVVLDSDHLFFAEDLFKDSEMYEVFRKSDAYYYEMLYQDKLKYQSFHQKILTRIEKQLR